MAFGIKKNVIEFEITGKRSEIKLAIHCTRVDQQRGKSLSYENLPINDTVLMEKHQCQRYFCCIKTCSRFIKFSRTLNLKHQISSIDIFHDQKEAFLKQKYKNKSTDVIRLSKFIICSPSFESYRIIQLRMDVV